MKQLYERAKFYECAKKREYTRRVKNISKVLE